MLNGTRQDKPLPPFDPVPGIEAREAGYIDWLLAGGAPIRQEAEAAWADTEKDAL